ncbi:sodium-dependent glucose transporter 1-like [Ptychodera flava]|uniref:sodium-dependent glucose transporter 1-like n=1 Tax=Ptychodera flava TaxID=63121 RepID=UPI00396A8EB9
MDQPVTDSKSVPTKNYDDDGEWLDNGDDDMKRKADEIEPLSGGGQHAKCDLHQETLSVRRLRVETFLIALSFFGFGTCIAVIGPSLPSLEHQLSEPIDKVSLAFTLRGIGYLLGALVAGHIFEKISYNLLFGTAMLCMAFAALAAAFCRNLIILLVVMAAWGFAMAFVDTGGNFVCVNSWKTKSGPYMQAIHFAFGVGATVSPLIVSPFLLDTNEPSNSTTLNVTTSMTSFDTTTELYFDDCETRLDEKNCSIIPENYDFHKDNMKLPNLWLPYGSLSIYHISVALAFFSLLLKDGGKCTPKQNKQIKDSNDQKIHVNHGKTKTITRDVILFVTVLSLLCLFGFCHVGQTAIFGGYIFTFAVESDLNFSVQEASYLTAVYWGSFTALRGFR